jgi:V8-like Glu-specific endopeptidase
MTNPLDHEELMRRGVIAADPPTDATIEVVVAEVEAAEHDELSLRPGDFTTRVVRRVGVDGWKDTRDRLRPEAVQLTRAHFAEAGPVPELPGYRPGGVETVFRPQRAPHVWRDVPTGEKRKQGGSIFDADDRFLFQDESFPWRTTGRVATAGGWGSGTVIGPRHVLTASHVVDWRRDPQGNIGWINFTPAYYDGRGPWGTFYATNVVNWVENPGSMTDDQTAFDYVVLVFSERIGDVLGFVGFRAYDPAWNGGSYWQSIGYPGERASGERPAFEGNGTVRTTSTHSTAGQTGYVMGHCKDFTPGQSGGPAWGWWDGEEWPRVVGVGSTIGDTVVKQSSSATTGNDNEYGGGPALAVLIDWARTNHP